MHTMWDVSVEHARRGKIELFEDEDDDDDDDDDDRHHSQMNRSLINE